MSSRTSQIVIHFDNVYLWRWTATLLEGDQVVDNLGGSYALVGRTTLHATQKWGEQAKVLVRGPLSTWLEHTRRSSTPTVDPITNRGDAA